MTMLVWKASLSRTLFDENPRTVLPYRLVKVSHQRGLFVVLGAERGASPYMGERSVEENVSPVRMKDAGFVQNQCVERVSRRRQKPLAVHLTLPRGRF